MTFSSLDSFTPRTWFNSIFVGLLVFAAAVATRLAHLNAVPFYDELYHLIAAQSWLRDGTLAIADGEYTRNPLYTQLTAWAFDLAGSTSAYSARLPNVILGSLLSALAVVWADRVAGRTAAIVVALLVLFWPSGIHVSQFARFYAIHGVLFFLGAISTYALFLPAKGWAFRLVMSVLALGFLWGALQFQESTMVGVLCMLVWVGFVVILPAVWGSRYRWVLLCGLVLMILAVIVAAFKLGIIQNFWTEYRESPWKKDPTAYNRILRDAYPLLWSLTPFLAIAALHRTPRPAGFCLVISTLGLLIHSFAGVQNVRYIYYFSPFLFALWAMGVQAVLPAVLEATRRALSDMMSPEAGRFLANGIVGFAVLFAVVANSAVPRAIKLALGKQAPPFVQRLSWAEAKTRVAELRDDGALVVSPNDLNAIAYVDGLDVTYSLNWLPEMNATEFATDPRTGKPLISTLASLKTVVGCTPRGVFVTDDIWTPPNGYLALFRVFQTPGVSLQTERVGRVQLLRWETDIAATQGAVSCDALPVGLR